MRGIRFTLFLIIFVCVFSVVSIGIVGYMSGRPRRIVSDRTPTPVVPSKYSHLPRSGSIICKTEGKIFVYELPGVIPGSLYDSYTSNTGKVLGHMDLCTKVQIEAIAWSHWDEKFYLRVTDEALRGWVEEEFVEVISE